MQGLEGAVQQCGVCNTAAVFKTWPQPLRSFVSWLPRHATLIKSLQIIDEGGCFVNAWAGTAEQLLVQAFKQSAAQHTACQPTAVGLVVPAGELDSAAESKSEPLPQQRQQRKQLRQQQHQQLGQHGLRLTSFATDIIDTPRLLFALPAHTITKLAINSSVANGRGLSIELARFN
jgi:hypothetical protein